jgi:hypothetical protein
MLIGVLVFCSEALCSTVKIAILDNSFDGYKEALGSSLPSDTKFYQGSVDAPENLQPHGLVMAQLLTKFLRGQSNRKLPYELHLYQTYGYTNFKEAVADVVKNKFDVVLYPQVWEYGGNGDGKGFINSIVNEAVNAGILWINAAGNFALGTFNYKVDPDADGWLALPEGGIPIRCEKSECDARIVLSWNDFRNDIELGTNKDLDLFLTDKDDKVIASAELIQRRMLDKDNEKFSIYPREILQTKLQGGYYFLKVKTNSRSWSADDRFRITVSGRDVTGRTNSVGESILNPADNPGVITVGSCDTSDSSMSMTLQKPELVAPSIMNLPMRVQYMGSSVAATLVAAGAVAYKTQDENLSRESFLRSVVPSLGQPRKLWQWNTPNYSFCKAPNVPFAKVFQMPSF